MGVFDQCIISYLFFVLCKDTQGMKDITSAANLLYPNDITEWYNDLRYYY